MPEISNVRKLMTLLFRFFFFGPVSISLFVKYYDNHTFKSVVL